MRKKVPSATLGTSAQPPAPPLSQCWKLVSTLKKPSKKRYHPSQHSLGSSDFNFDCLGGGGPGAVIAHARWYFFSQTPEPNLALLSRSIFGSSVDGEEIEARFYGMSVDPQPIRAGLCGIRDDQKRVKKRAYDTHAETQPIRRRLSHTAQPGHRRGSAHVSAPLI